MLLAFSEHTRQCKSLSPIGLEVKCHWQCVELVHVQFFTQWKAVCFRLSRKEVALFGSMFWACRQRSFGSLVLLIRNLMYIGECTRKTVGVLSVSEQKMLLFVKIVVCLLIKMFYQIRCKWSATPTQNNLSCHFLCNLGICCSLK